MTKFAIIPARGGSKRIPGKNIKPFAGKPIIGPIIGYSIEAALRSHSFDRVIVSTGDEEIISVAEAAYTEMLSLPVYPGLTGEDVAWVVTELRQAVELAK